MRLLRAVILVLTAAFVVLLFTPLVREMLFRLSATDTGVP